MSAPTHLGPTDLDYDGQNLWLSAGTGEVRRLDPVTGGIGLEFRIASWTQRDNGIAARPGGELWIGNLFGGLSAYGATGNVKGSVVHDNGCPFVQAEVGPSVFVGSQFVTLSTRGITYYSVAP